MYTIGFPGFFAGTVVGCRFDCSTVCWGLLTFQVVKC